MKALSWYGRPAASLCLAAALVASSLVALGRERPSEGGGRSRPSYSITIRHHGVDGREMERSVSIPLEDALSAIAGVQSITSVSEYGKARVSVRFGRASKGDRIAARDAVRDAAQRVYELLPRSAQRPEIDSSDDSRIPVWTAAAMLTGKTEDGVELGRILDRVVKPALERIPGAGEVEIAGSGELEIAVLVNEEVAAALGIDSLAVARALGASDGLFPAGKVRDGEREFTVTADGRFPSETALRRAPIPTASGSSVPLDAVATVERRSREPEARSRVNGVSVAVVAVIPAADADLGALSRAIGNEIAALAHEGLKFEVLADRGAEESASFRSILFAAIQGATATAVAGALLAGGAARGRRRGRIAAICAAAVPAVLVVSAAALSVLGFPLDGILLAGLAAGLGSAVDSAILTAERLGPCADIAEGREAMRILSPSLAAGAATNLVVLVPLAALDDLSSGTARIAAAVAASTVVALAAAYVVLPPLLLAGGRDGSMKAAVVSSSLEKRAESRRSHHPFRAVRRTLVRLLGRNARLCAARPAVPLIFAGLLTLAGASAAILSGADVSAPAEGGTLYAHLEFESGATAESVDRRLAVWASALSLKEGLKSVQTSGRGGSGSALISFDRRRTDRASVAAHARAAPLSGGFIFIPEPSAGERVWQLTFAGDDDGECRRLAEEAARLLSASPVVRETVLNFKDGPARLELVGDRDRLAAAGLSFAAAADSLRRSVHAPVAYKRIDEDRETDLRVGGKAVLSADLADLPISGEGGQSVRLGSVMSERRRAESARIRREDRRRVASLSVRTAAMDPRRAREAVMAALDGIELPPLYSIKFDRDAIEAAEALSHIFVLLLLAILLCYMTVAAATESFGAPLAVLSVVPPSLALPALIVTVASASIDAATAAAFVAVSGMAVNASILTVDEYRRRSGGAEPPTPGLLYRVARSRLASLAATCGTTVVGAVPFLFLAEAGNAVARSLAVVSVAGVAASFVCAFTVVPALAAACPRLFLTYDPSAADPLGAERSGIGSSDSDRRDV